MKPFMFSVISTKYDPNGPINDNPLSAPNKWEAII